jgi:hypothetical protein
MKLAPMMRRLGWWMFALTFIWMIAFMFIGFFTINPAVAPDALDSEASASLPQTLERFFALFFGGTVFFALGSTGLIWGASIVNALKDRSIRTKGKSAEATILKISETGMTVNDNPVVKFLLEVSPAGEPHFQAEAERLVSRLDIPQFQPGKSVQVRYDPDSKAVALC